METPTLKATEDQPSALVIDDDEDIVYLLRHMLMRDGYSVETAASGREALEHIELSPPSTIVTLDLMLPYVDGLELIRRIRNEPLWSDVPIIVISGKVVEHDIVSALEAGANDYVTKPYSPLELRARIARHTRLHRQSR